LSIPAKTENNSGSKPPIPYINNIERIPPYLAKDVIEFGKLHNEYYKELYPDVKYKPVIEYKMEDYFIRLETPSLFKPNDWIVPTLLTCLIVIAITRSYFSKYLTLALQSLFSYSTAFKLYRENNTLQERVSWALSLLFGINSSLFLIELLDYYEINLFNGKNFVAFLVFIGFFVLLTIAKKIILTFLGIITDELNSFAEYKFTISLFNRGIGLFLIPVVICIPFTKGFLPTLFVELGLGFFALFFLLRIGRGLKIILIKGVSLFYAFLYLCALEFLPLLVLYRFFNSFIFN